MVKVDEDYSPAGKAFQQLRWLRAEGNSNIIVEL